MEQKETKQILKSVANVFNKLGEKNSLLGEIKLEDYTLTRRKWDTTQIYLIAHKDEAVVEFHANTKNSTVYSTVKNEKAIEPLKQFLDRQEIMIGLGENMKPNKESRQSMRLR